MKLLAGSTKMRGVLSTAALCGLLLCSSVEAFETEVTVSESLDWAERASGLSSPNGTSIVEHSYAQSQQRAPQKVRRSQSEVVRQVKRQYNAEVLKISMNQSGSAYRVRILMPNGRVREVSVSAYR